VRPRLRPRPGATRPRPREGCKAKARYYKAEGEADRK